MQCALFFFLTIILASTSAKVCVLEPMVTLSHPRCTPPVNCEGRYQWDLEDDDDYTDIKTIEDLPPLQPGSPAYSHYQSLRSDDLPTKNGPFIRSFARKITYNSATPQCQRIACGADCRYRSYDASNNNLKNSTWGAADSIMLRLHPPNYSGENGMVGKTLNGSKLPDARYISTTIFPNAYRPSLNNTLAVMQWGQLVAHDSGLSPNGGANCCSDAGESVDDCMPIKIPKNDPFFSRFNQTCLNMMRTRSVNSQFGCMEFPNQISSVTHYIDMSMMYGSNDSHAYDLRLCKGGRMEMYRAPDGRYFPALSYDGRIDCSSVNRSDFCFRSGDVRINQNTQLTCLMVVLLREHNRIATEFSKLNPHWDDERLYQETRNLMIAQFQHISYKNYLPLILGSEHMEKFNLTPLTTGYSKAYNDSVSAATINSFMTGAFRSFHSTIQGRLWMVDPVKQCPFAALNISDYMQRPGIILPGNNLDELLLGLTIEPDQVLDRFFTTQMTEMMFHGDERYGEDLESYDIQRGRDHGLPTYNVMRELCHRPRAKTFDDLVHDIGELHVSLLKKAYASVDDVDYFVGGILEHYVENSSVGPTFLCVLIEQFVRKKIGDRFWYENGGMVHSFTEGQLDEIRKSTVSRLLCDNGDNITQIQPDSFKFPSTKNKIVPCSQIPSINLTAWIEELPNSTTSRKATASTTRS